MTGLTLFFFRGLTQILARSRSRRCSIYTSPAQLIANAASAPSTPAPFEALPPTDPEALWCIRAPEWSWTPAPTLTELVPSISLTPPSDEDDFQSNADPWTPLQSALCPRTGKELLTVRTSYVFNNPRPHAECVACGDGYAEWVRDALREGWGVEGSVEEVLGMEVDHQRGWGLHAKVWAYAVGSCVCREVQGWYTPEHVPGQDEEEEEEHGDGEMEAPEDAEGGWYYEHEEVYTGHACESGYASDDGSSTSTNGVDWEVNTPVGISGYASLPEMSLADELAAAADVNVTSVVEVHSEDDEDEEFAVPGVTSKSPYTSQSDVFFDSPTAKTTRWMDLADEDDELPDLTGW